MMWRIIFIHFLSHGGSSAAAAADATQTFERMQRSQTLERMRRSHPDGVLTAEAAPASLDPPATERV